MCYLWFLMKFIDETKLVTDGPTDRPSYRDVRTLLKICLFQGYSRVWSFGGSNGGPMVTVLYMSPGHIWGRLRWNKFEPNKDEWLNDWKTDWLTGWLTDWLNMMFSEHFWPIDAIRKKNAQQMDGPTDGWTEQRIAGGTNGGQTLIQRCKDAS